MTLFRSTLALVLALASAGQASAQDAARTFVPIAHDAEAQTVTLTGHALSVEQVIAIARHGARVTLSPDARQRSANAYGLLLEAAAEGVSVYWFNRGAGDQRETVIFAGDPTTPENTALLKARQFANFARGETGSSGPQIEHEDVIRAMMAIRANTMSYEAASPGLTQMLLDLINHDITPIVHARGSLGEGDLAPLGELGRAMIGQGDVHYKGQRMPAAQALREAGLTPLVPFGADDAALISTDAWFTANTALLVADAGNMLQWADLGTAMAMTGMNSSMTPLSMPVQTNRPYPWLNWDAARVLDMLRGGYLLQDDPGRIIQDPESLRASTQRIGSAWQSWADLRDSVVIAMNASDHNPAVRPGLKPGDSWELSTPQMMKFHVKGGPLSHGMGGYILSNANWDPYPLANQVEAFTIATANMGVILLERMERFSNPFFTGVKPTDVMTPDQARALPGAAPYLSADLWIEIAGLINPVVPQGQPIIATVEDLQGETRLKVDRARQAVDLTTHLLALDLIVSSNWVEVRKAQDRSRRFGAVPTALLAGLRTILPLQQHSGPSVAEDAVYGLITTTPASRFYPGGPPPPAAGTVPVAQVRASGGQGPGALGSR